MSSPPLANLGKVFLVGAGPGEPELLTVRAARILAAADAIVYDHLVNPHILDIAPIAAQRLYVGKEAGKHTLPQNEINQLLVQLAQEGKQVVRLKGGDPFIFGRGGEEVAELLQSTIPFEVVPGITAASGAAAFAGIPLTHRDFAQACIFATGHLQDGSCSLDWPLLARPQQTVVIYMGIGALPIICEQLIHHGLAPETPAAVVRNATLQDQLTLVSTVRDLPAQVKQANIQPPAILIIGHVVSLHTQLNWFK